MEMIYEYQLQMSPRLVSGYQLPTDVGRYDTTSFNVWHQQKNLQNGLLALGHSKDHRPDLLQYKQGFGGIGPRRHSHFK